MRKAQSCDVVLVDDDAIHARQITRMASAHNLAVSSVAPQECASLSLSTAQLAIITSKQGNELVQSLKARSPGLCVIVLGDGDKADHVLACMRAGARDVLPGDLSQPEAMARLKAHFGQCVARCSDDKGGDTACRFGLAGRSQAMERIRHTIGKLAPRDTTVLVDGPTGAGKELIALAIHREGHRSSGPLVAVNCAAIPDDLWEGEFFGYEKGAFSGAVNSYPGKFALADGGTLFLDEIGELSMMGQIKLLRALEARQCYKLGGRRPHSFDVRIVAATNRDLAAEVEAGRFRSDLYYRIAVARISIPPLALRRDDIVPLARHFLAETAQPGDCDPPILSEEAVQAMEAYDWPGNARELRNAIEVALINHEDGQVRVSDLPLPSSPTTARIAVPMTSPRTAPLSLSQRAVAEALRLCGGNKSEAARRLGCSRMTLYRRLKSA